MGKKVRIDKQGPLCHVPMGQAFFAVLWLVVLLIAGPAQAADLEPPALPADATSTCPRQWPSRIDTLQVTGLWRTELSIVQDELPWRAGEVVTAEQWQLGLARLWNLGLFSRVDTQLRCEGAEVQAQLNLEERWTLNPLFSFQVLVRGDAKPGESSTWWTVGASELNLLGRHVEIAGLYSEFNGLAGGQVFGRLYNLGGLRLDALLQAELLVRPRPGFADRRALLRADLARQWQGDRLRLGLRLDVLSDTFHDAGDGPPALPGAAKTALLDMGLRVGRVDVVRVRQFGHSLEARPGVAVTSQEGHSDLQVHGQLWLQGLAYFAPGERWNLALRVQAAAQTAAPAQLQWFIGGLYEVRGVRDSYARTSAYALVNAEARWTMYDATWLAVIPTAFVDAAVLRDVQRGPLLLASTGAGVRLLVPRFVRTGFRFDLAQPLADMPCGTSVARGLCPGLSLGVFQYF